MFFHPYLVKKRIVIGMSHFVPLFVDSLAPTIAQNSEPNLRGL